MQLVEATDGTVRALLERGANTRVRTVTGITAVSMGRRYLQPDTATVLEAAEAMDSRPWRDYRYDPDAVAAQAEHTRLSPSYRNNLTEQDAANAAAEDIERTAQAAAIAGALQEGKQAGREAVVSTLLQAFRKRKIDHRTEDILQRAFNIVFSLEDTRILLIVLDVCREDEMGLALSARGLRDRRAVQMLFSTLLSELEASGDAVLNDVLVSGVAASTTPSLAMEVVSLKTSFHAAGDRQAVESMWKDVFATLANTSVAGIYVSDVSYVTGLRLPKNKGGIVMSECVRLLRWAVAMQTVSPLWFKMAEDVVSCAMRIKHADKLIEAVNEIPEGLPPKVEEMIYAAWKLRPQAVALKGAASPALSGRTSEVLGLDGCDFQEYKLASAVRWLSEDQAIGSIRDSLQSMLNDLDHEVRLMVGIDTEWGEAGGHDSHAAPSVVQIAALDHVWVVDTLMPGPCTRSLIRWLFGCKRLLLLGFAFAHDVLRLASLALDKDHTTSPHNDLSQAEVLDIQLLAQRHAPKGLTPGLKTVAEAWLGITIDKSEQCSDWDRRPLSVSQLRYAAIDAVVLLDIAQAMGVDSGLAIAEVSHVKHGERDFPMARNTNLFSGRVTELVDHVDSSSL